MPKPKFKYNINHELSLIPRHITIADVEKVLRDDFGISRDTFYRDRNMLISEQGSIPTDRLEIYAALFGIKPDDLKNYRKPRIKPLARRFMSTEMRRVLKKNGLKLPRI